MIITKAGLMLPILALLLHAAPSQTTTHTPGECIPTSQGDGVDKKLHMLCYLAAINSHAETTNFSLIPAENTVSLTVQCIDKNSVSNLEPRGLRSLVWLE